MGDDTVPLFVAQGQLGRTTVSCDGGDTWIGEHTSLDSYMGRPIAEMTCDNFTCDCNCDHNAHPARGIVFGGGFFIATFGWGETGLVQRTQDGATWEVVLEDSKFGGLAYVQSTWIAADAEARRSLDGGATWSEPMSTGHGVRRVGQTTAFEGRVILVGESGQAAISSDAGLTWWLPETFPAACGAGIQFEGGIVSNGAVWLMVGGDGVTCRSTDGGNVWVQGSVGSVGSGVSSHLVWNGTVFQVWSPGQLHESGDGLSWSSRAVTPENLTIGAVASDEHGGLAAVRGGWNSWDENQEFYRSADGLVWELASHFTKGDSIRTIAFGYGKKPAECP